MLDHLLVEIEGLAGNTLQCSVVDTDETHIHAETESALKAIHSRPMVVPFYTASRLNGSPRFQNMLANVVDALGILGGRRLVELAAAQSCISILGNEKIQIGIQLTAEPQCIEQALGIASQSAAPIP